ncbi:MAG: CpsD/CapB family tyrosine-protein kinase [Acidobacteriota bacterium]|nr:CpsD/CapB family tyrosine-protein kinase [Acidobacteriota bacterium]
MSKIYEALRQAEIDRAQSPAPPAPPQEFAAAQAVLDPYPTLVAQPDPPRVLLPELHTPPLPAPEPIAIPAQQIDSIAAAPVDPPALDLTGVKSYSWAPSIDQLPALEERGSAVEQFRSLRSRMHEFRDLNSLKSILVSSGLPQEGKSFVAANLAIAFARHKAARVLLIDGDMRRSTLHKLLGTTQGPGLTEYLAGKSTLSEVMQRPSPDDPDHPLHTGLASLTFIPGGFDHSKAADLSGNHKFDRLIESVAPFFDWIVVDSSPVNLVADAVNLARGCDAALLVARGSVTRYETAQRALGELKASKVLGFVLNAVADHSVAGGYYGYDGYDAYYAPKDTFEEPAGSVAQ